MKYDKPSSVISASFLVLLMIIPAGMIRAQFPFGHDSAGHRRYYLNRVVYLETKKNPTLYKITEKQRRDFTVESKTDTSLSKITRIRGDSIYLDGNGYRFRQIKSILLKTAGPTGPVLYKHADSTSWKIYFPPDSVYGSKFTFSKYQHWINRRRKHDKFEWIAPAFKHNVIKFCFSRLANLEIAIAYEYRVSKKWSWEIEAGYQFNGNNNMGDDGPLDVYPLYKYRGFSVNTGPKYYFNSRGYIQTLVQYRYLEMSSTRTRFLTERYHLEDQYRNDVGFSIRVGQLIRMGPLTLDGYFGLGIKAMLIHQLDYGTYEEDDIRLYWYNNNHAPEVNNLVHWYPIIGLGIKIGFGF